MEHLRSDLRNDLRTKRGSLSDSDPGLLSGDPSGSLSKSDLTRSDRRGKQRGKAGDYSATFEVAWQAYGRRQEKGRAWFEWQVQARIEGTESALLKLVVHALDTWQRNYYTQEGWQFAPYFERYLKNRKWEDEPLPTRIPLATVAVDRTVQLTDAHLARQRAAVDPDELPTWAQLKELRGK